MELLPLGQALTLRPDVLNPQNMIDMVDIGALSLAPSRRLAGQTPGQAALRDPAAFFAMTYPTEEIVQTLRTLARRAERPEEVPGTLLLSGRYGQGKSHVLLAAHHALSAPDMVLAWAARWGLGEIRLPQGAVVLTRSFIEQGSESLWDLLFGGLRRTSLLEGMGAFPDGQRIRAALGTQPVFLIMDELERWYSAQPEKDQSQARNYLQALSEVANRDGRLTILTSVLGEEHEPAETLRRVRPLELSFRSAEDRQRVVLFRMFEDREAPGPTAERARAVEVYREAWTQAGLPGVDALAARLADTWPFSPEFLDILTRRIPDLSGFQSTRGTLRFLAAVVRATADRQSLITSQDLPLQDDGVANALRLIDSEGGEVVRRALGDNYVAVRDLPMRDGLFSTILLYSIADPTRRGATREDILRAMSGPGVNTNLVLDALERLRQMAFNLHMEENRYLFKAMENPYARINFVASSQLVQQDACWQHIAATLRQVWGAEDQTILYRHPDREGAQHALQSNRQRLRYLISTASLDAATRLQLQNLAERRNMVLLIEPRIRVGVNGGPYNLLGDEGMRQLAARIEACHLLLSGKPGAEAQRIYRAALTEAAEQLQRHVREAYGIYIRWNRSGTESRVDDTWYDVTFLDNPSAATFHALLQREFTSVHEVERVLRAEWASFRNRRASHIRDHLECTPGLPIPLTPEVVPQAIRRAVQGGVFGLADARGHVYGSSDILSLPEDQLPDCAVVDAPVVARPPPPQEEPLWPVHPAVSGRYDPAAPGVSLAWQMPAGRYRTLVQRYTSRKGWEIGRAYPMDLNQTHEANRYIGPDSGFTDGEGLTPGVWYHYFVFLVEDLGPDQTRIVLSQRCDVQVPLPTAPVTPDRLDVVPQPSRGRLLTEVEKLVMSPRNMGADSRIRKVEVRINGVDSPQVREVFVGLQRSVALECQADIRLVWRGEYDRQALLQQLRQLPNLESAMYSASLHLKREG